MYYSVICAQNDGSYSQSTCIIHYEPLQVLFLRLTKLIMSNVGV